MRWSSFRVAGRDGFGVTRGGKLLDLSSVMPGVPTLRSALQAGVLAELGARADDVGRPVRRAAVTLLPPIPDPAKIIGVGLNYRAHCREVGAALPAHPVLFVRFANSVVAHGQPVVCPAASAEFEYEGELAVIIGRRARHVAAEGALDIVAGYACFAENSIRDFQRHSPTATAGKNFTASGAFGPDLVTAEAVGDPGSLCLETRLNGVAVQRGSTADMVFSVPELIAYVTSFAELEPGDVLATGTPPGLASGRVPPSWMKPGDYLEVEVERVGVLANAVIAEAGHSSP